MKFIKSLTLLLVLLPQAIFANDEDRILSIGGTVTEIIYALEAQDRLVGRDTTSSFPPEAKELPDVGYMRALAPEGVLSVNPNLIIAEQGSGPAETIETLKSTGITYIEVPDGFTAEAIAQKIMVIGDAIGRKERAQELAASVEQKINAQIETAPKPTEKKRALFILSAKDDKIVVAGENTSANAILELAGAENVATGFNGYKTMTNEAILTANPDVIVMMEGRGGHDVSQKLFEHPAIKMTKAAEDKALIQMNGLLLLGFGPRTAEAIRTLSENLYPQ